MMNSETSARIYPEAWGAHPVMDPRGGDYELAKSNSMAFAAMLNDIAGPYGDHRFFAASVFLSGWYPICEEIRVSRFTLDLQGKGPAFGASGLKWIGPTRSEQSMIHFTESDFSRISRVGLLGQLTSDPDSRLLAAIRTSWQPGTGPQRRLRFEDLVINDVVGYHEQPGQGYAFKAGILSGGPGSMNGNDDFFVVDNVNIGMCESAIRVTNSMAVQWSIENFGAYNCDYMYYSDMGGSVLGRNWYPNSFIERSVFHCAGPIHESLHIDVTGFDCEHMRCESLISATSSLTGQLQGRFIHAAALAEPRDFYWLKLKNHCNGHFVFRDLVGSTSHHYGNAPLRHLVQLGPHLTSDVNYSLAFDNCRGIEDLVSLWQPGHDGESHRTVELAVNGKRRLVKKTQSEFTTVGELVRKRSRRG